MAPTRPLAGFLGLALFFVALSAQTQSTVSAHVDRVHSRIVADLNDLSLFMKDGRLMTLEEAKRARPEIGFGTSRISKTYIDAHLHGSFGPNIREPNHATSIHIFGNRGRALSANGLALRYHRIPDRGGDRTRGVATNPQGHKPVDKSSLARKVVASWGKSPPKPFRTRDGVHTIEFRPILLTKRACLSCHAGMQVGEPVAVAMYTLTPLVERRRASKPRR